MDVITTAKKIGEKINELEEAKRKEKGKLFERVKILKGYGFREIKD